MWPSGGDRNEFGEPIWLLEPSRDAHDGPNIESDSALSSFLGGSPSFYRGDDSIRDADMKWICSKCQGPLLLLLQMYAPMHEVALDRSLYVLACNKYSCWRSLFQQQQQRFHLGGDGVVICIRSQQLISAATSCRHDATSVSNGKTTKKKAMAQEWSDVTAKAVADISSGDDMEHLEQLIAALEAKEAKPRYTNHPTQNHTASQPKKMKPRPKDSHNNNITEYNNQCVSANHTFAKIILQTVEEPPGIDDTLIGDDHDDHLGLSYIPDDGIQTMLSKYLEQEEDEDIKSILTNQTGTNHISIQIHQNGGKDNGTEAYEHLDSEQRAFFTFLHRIRRAPSQSIRYAYGACPLWSIPTSKSHRVQDTLQVPSCICGSARCFEFQIMPTVLHILKCDDHDKLACPSALSEDRINWGMHWGMLAVFSCADSCTLSREEFVVIQKEPTDDDPL